MPRRRSADAARPGVAGLEQRVLARLRASALPRRARIVLGFSGGADSLALAGLLRTMQRRGMVEVVAAHVDHGLRETSGEEAQAAAELAERIGLSFRIVRLQDNLLDRHPGVGIEEAARRERYVALALIAEDEAAAALCVAHHASDQAETVLLHLLRGAGLPGARGMAEWNELAVPWWTDSSDLRRAVRIWRPLLNEPLATVRGYAAGLGLVAIHDPSNDDLSLRRNLVRESVLPILENVTPGATAALARFAGLAGDDDDLLEEIARRALEVGRSADGGLDVSRLLAQPPAIQRRIAQRWIAEGERVHSRVSANRVEAVLALARSGRGRRSLQLGGGLAATLREGRLYAGRSEADTAGADPGLTAGAEPLMDPGFQSRTERTKSFRD